MENDETEKKKKKKKKKDKDQEADEAGDAPEVKVKCGKVKLMMAVSALQKLQIAKSAYFRNDCKFIKVYLK